MGIPVDQILGESYGLLDIEGAPPGSELYLISTNNYSDQQEYVSNRLDPISDLFFERQWHVSSFSLTGTPVSNLQVSKTLAGSTGGNIFQLDNILDAAFSPAPFTHDDCSLVILKAGGDDFTGTGAEVVD